jgi:ribosomal protein L11 methyltransferase
MDYIEVGFSGLSEEHKDHLIGWLTGWNHNGILEENDLLKVYFSQDDFIENEMAALAQRFSCSFQHQIIPEQNWNSQWEHHFQPVILGSFCGIRADFHSPIKGVKYELIVTPKMSFGTGHHATTALMIRLMETLDLADKRVFDFGCGTGILAILSEKMGAGSILALDNDEWSVRNAIENAAVNSCTRIEVKNEAINQVSSQFDCIFANINRNVLLAYMKTFPMILADGGRLLMSGFFSGEDEEVVQSAVENTGLRLLSREVEENWAALLFQK